MFSHPLNFVLSCLSVSCIETSVTECCKWLILESVCDSAHYIGCFQECVFQPHTHTEKQTRVYQLFFTFSDFQWLIKLKIIHARLRLRWDLMCRVDVLIRQCLYAELTVVPHFVCEFVCSRKILSPSVWSFLACILLIEEKQETCMLVQLRIINCPQRCVNGFMVC